MLHHYFIPYDRVQLANHLLGKLCPGGNAIVTITSPVQNHAHSHLYFAHLSPCEPKQRWIVFVGMCECVFLISSLSPCCFCNGSSRPLHTLSFLMLIEHVVLLNYSNWCQQLKNVCLSPPSTFLPPPTLASMRSYYAHNSEIKLRLPLLDKVLKKRRPSLDGFLAKWDCKLGTLAGSVHKHGLPFIIGLASSSNFPIIKNYRLLLP